MLTSWSSKEKETIKPSTKAYSNNKTVYINDFIKQNHNKGRAN